MTRSQKSKKRKTRAKGRAAKVIAILKARQEAYDKHGKNPQANPSNANGIGHDMHRPGSKNPRK